MCRCLFLVLALLVISCLGILPSREFPRRSYPRIASVVFKEPKGDSGVPVRRLVRTERTKRAAGGAASLSGVYGLAQTMLDSQPSAVLYPAGYITSALMDQWAAVNAGNHFMPSAEIEALEKETLQNQGHFTFTANPVLTSKKELLAKDFVPSPTESYLYRMGACNPRKKIVQLGLRDCGPLFRRMAEIYANPRELRGTAVQLSGYACTMASFDMVFHTKTGEFTGRLNSGGSSYSGGRSKEEVAADYKLFKFEQIESADATRWTHALAITLQAQIDLYGSAMADLQSAGHALVLDGFLIVKGECRAAYVRDPMYGLAFMIRWDSLSTVLRPKGFTFAGNRIRDKVVDPDELLILESGSDELTTRKEAAESVKKEVITETDSGENLFPEKQEDSGSKKHSSGKKDDSS